MCFALDQVLVLGMEMQWEGSPELASLLVRVLGGEPREQPPKHTDMQDLPFLMHW